MSQGLKGVSPFKGQDFETKVMERKLDHDMKIEDEKIENLYDTCCARQTDKRLLRFIIQLCVTCGILVFCFVKLSQEVECAESNVLYSLISGISGFWLTKV